MFTFEKTTILFKAKFYKQTYTMLIISIQSIKKLKELLNFVPTNFKYTIVKKTYFFFDYKSFYNSGS